MNGATTTGLRPVETGTAETASRRGRAAESRSANGARSSSEVKARQKALQRKYRHIAAIHSESQPSCLSHDSVVSPSFLGFRNLGVIVLGMRHIVPSYSGPSAAGGC